MNELIKSYLTNRKQFVIIDKTKSNLLDIKKGVPQGSVIGPLLYILYVMSLQKASLKARYFTFADDTILAYNDSSLEKLITTVNEDLILYKKWLLHNKLKVNEMKCVYMIFKQKNMIMTEVEVKLDETILNRVKYTKYLGLTIDESLDWSEHVHKMKQKITPMIGAIYRCRSYIDDKAKYCIYNAYFLSIYRYMITIWGTCGITTLNKTQVLQNRVIKVLFNLDYRMSTDNVYAQVKLDKLEIILKIEQCKFIYKLVNSQLKTNTEMSQRNQVHTHDTRQKHKLHIQKPRTNKVLNNPIDRAIKAYNEVPEDIKNIASFNKFKILLKNWCLSKLQT